MLFVVLIDYDISEFGVKVYCGMCWEYTGHKNEKTQSIHQRNEKGTQGRAPGGEGI